VVNLIHAAPGNVYSASLLLVLSIATILIAFLARVFALKAQDRAIRAEENFRHYLATGKQLDSRLTIGQIIALRFAGDDEFVELAKKAANENMSSKDIKMAIQHWKGDYYRV
jgi:NOL1/NOP2/fmu family ribosome biogenesis protein